VSVMVSGSPFAFRWGTAAPRAEPREAVASGVRRGRTAGRAVRRAGVEAADRRRADPESRCAVPVARPWVTQAPRGSAMPAALPGRVALPSASLPPERNAPRPPIGGGASCGGAASATADATSLRSMDRPSLLRRAASAMLSLRLARLASADAASANRVNDARANHAICTRTMHVNKIRHTRVEIVHAIAPMDVRRRSGRPRGRVSARAGRGGGSARRLRRRGLADGRAARHAAERLSRAAPAAPPAVARRPCRPRAGGSAGCRPSAPARAPPSR
jgi:hypothetical protein